jgi:hypothetical protein
MKMKGNSMKKTVLIVSIFLLLASVCSYAQDQQKDMLDLAAKLELCEVYTQKFIHPFTGESLERKIEGLVDGKCLYIEEMPNGGKMECRYSVESRKAVAQYYRNIAKAQSSGTKVELSLGYKKQEAKYTYTINGKEVENPLQECLDNGTCTISGY